MILTRKDEPVSTLVLEEVATIEDTNPVDLPPLFDAVDPDALDSVFEPTMSRGQRVGRIEFAYAGHDIRVEYDGEPIVTVD